jgi:GT2 family glycosyltransferase
MNKPPTISVIILTSDRPHLLEKALTSIHKQKTQPIEVVIVDGSTQLHKQTVAVIKSHTNTLHIIKRNTKHSIPYGRTLGAKTAHGDIVVYLDDDCVADRKYLAKFQKHFQRDPTLTAVIGRITNSHEDNIYAATQFAYYQRGLNHFFPGLKRAVPLLWGRILDCEVMGIRRSTLLSFGFPERHRRYRNDDVELGLRLVQAGKTIYFDPTIIAHATPRVSFGPLWTAAFWNGYSDACTIDEYKVDLRASPYPTFFPVWFIKEICSAQRFPILQQFYYGLLLIIFPTVSRIGKLWYHVVKFYEYRHHK